MSQPNKLTEGDTLRCLTCGGTHEFSAANGKWSQRAMVSLHPCPKGQECKDVAYTAESGSFLFSDRAEVIACSITRTA